MKSLTYAQRARHFTIPLAQNLLCLMDEKKTNLALAADCTHADELLGFAEIIGPELCVLKTHIDILEDFSAATIRHLTALAKKHQFFIFEDRKFADIGMTVKRQYQSGLYRIAEWADLINAHALPGKGIIAGLKEVGLPLNRAALLLAEMSGENTLFTENYTKKCFEMACEHKDFIMGFVAQKRFIEAPDFIYFSPGIHLTESGDSFSQTYRLPHDAIYRDGIDIAIAGRVITASKTPLTTAQTLRQMAWDAYMARIQQ